MLERKWPPLLLLPFYALVKESKPGLKSLIDSKWKIQFLKTRREIKQLNSQGKCESIKVKIEQDL